MKWRMAWVVLAVGSTLGCGANGWGQSTPTRTLYRIGSGSYTERGGFVGEVTVRLPNPTQAYVALSQGAAGEGATLEILRQDRETVKFMLTNGVVSGSAIEFSYSCPYPVVPGQLQPARVDYSVSNTGGVLTFSGAIQVIDPPCCDIPFYFGHSKVVADRMPELTVRASEVELCWETAPGQVWQPQCRSDLTTNRWVDLGGSVVAGAGGTVCVAQHLTPGAPQQFYRLVGPANRPPTRPSSLWFEPGGCGLLSDAGYRCSWTPSIDPDGDAIAYEYASNVIACGCLIEPWYCPVVEGRTSGTSVVIGDYASTLPAWFRVRAVDPLGAVSDWLEGAFQ
jgi:hypothetical protein